MEEIDKRQRSVDKMRIREADNARAEMAEHHQQNRYTLDVVEKRDARFLFDGMAADDEVGAAEAEDAPDSSAARERAFCDVADDAMQYSPNLR